MSASAAAVAPAWIETPQPEPAFELRTSRRHALVVDDNPDITDMLAEVLRRVGYNVSTAHSALRALEAAHAKQFDVVISDIGMPGMDGYELARELRMLPEYGTTWMVAVTGFAMYDDRDRALEAGFDAHLSKPIDPTGLTRAICGVRH
jgi:CheY-like chemotaxis protein